MDELESIRLLPEQDGLDEAIRAFVAAHGGVLIDEIREAPPRPSEWVWSIGTGVELQYVDDPLFDLRYAVVTGHDVLVVANQLHAFVPCHTIDTVVPRWHEAARDGDPRILCRIVSALAVLAPIEPAAQVAECLERALAHPEPAVRQAAVQASRAVRWPRLVDALERRRDSELHLDVQAAIDDALTDLDGA
jgi:hypothetical protein